MNVEAGVRIAQLRRERKWTQTQLADAADIAVSTLRRWESGEIVPQTGSCKRVLTALGTTKRQQQETLALLDRPSSVQELGSKMWTPHTGDLLRVLRLRRGLSLSQAAALLRTAKSTISRWEKGSVPEPERLNDICAVYAAFPEECVALANSKSLLIPPVIPGDSLETCEQRLHELIDTMESSEPFAGEPCFILLEAQFASWAKKCDKALRLLTLCWTYHSDYLNWRHRDDEAYKYADRALRVAQSCLQPEAFWLRTVSMQAQYAGEHSAHGLQASYVQLKSWLELAERVGCDICVLRNLGGFAAGMGQWEHSRQMFTASRRIAQQREMDWGIRLANMEEAESYLSEGKPEGALPFLAQDDKFDPNGHLTEIKLWVQTLQALGSNREADSWITRGDALLAAHDLDFRRAEWERLKQRG